MNFPQLVEFIKGLDVEYLKKSEDPIKCTLYQPGTCEVHEHPEYARNHLILGFLGTVDDTKIQVAIGNIKHSDTVNAEQFVYAFEGNIIQYFGQFTPVSITCDKPVYVINLLIRNREKHRHFMENTMAYKVKHGYLVYEKGFTYRDYQVPNGGIVFPFLGP